jgi:hypothetical protein
MLTRHSFQQRNQECCPTDLDCVRIFTIKVKLYHCPEKQFGKVLVCESLSVFLDPCLTFSFGNRNGAENMAGSISAVCFVDSPFLLDGYRVVL